MAVTGLAVLLSACSSPAPRPVVMEPGAGRAREADAGMAAGSAAPDAGEPIPCEFSRASSRYRTHLGEPMTLVSEEGHKFAAVVSYDCQAPTTPVMIAMCGRSGRMCDYAELRVDGMELLEPRWLDFWEPPYRCNVQHCRDGTLVMSRQDWSAVLAAEDVELIICIDKVHLTPEILASLKQETVCPARIGPDAGFVPVPGW